MEDVLTEVPPPSRFYEEDLNNFAVPSPPLPSPFLLPNPNSQIPKTPTLVLLISPSSLSLLHQIPSKTLVASLFLPSVPLSSHSPINIYHITQSETLLAAFNCPVPSCQSKAVAKLLSKEFDPEIVIIFDAIKAENYRGKFGDEEEVFKLETRRAREEGLVAEIRSLGSGSLVDGIGAAMMGECEMKGKKGTMVVTVPGANRGRMVLRSLVKGVLGIELVDDAAQGATAGSGSTSSWLESDLYT